MSAVLDLDAIPAVAPDVPNGPWRLLDDLQPPASLDDAKAARRLHEASCRVAQLVGTMQHAAEVLVAHHDADMRRLGTYLVNKLELAQRGVRP